MLRLCKKGLLLKLVIIFRRLWYSFFFIILSREGCLWCLNLKNFILFEWQWSVNTSMLYLCKKCKVFIICLSIEGVQLHDLPLATSPCRAVLVYFVCDWLLAFVHVSLCNPEVFILLHKVLSNLFVIL